MLLTSPRPDRSVPLIPSSAANSGFSCKIFLVFENVYIFFKFIFVDTNAWLECLSILFKFQIWFTKLLNNIEYILMITLGSCYSCKDTTRILYRPIEPTCSRIVAMFPQVRIGRFYRFSMLTSSEGIYNWMIHPTFWIYNIWIPIITGAVLINC